MGAPMARHRARARPAAPRSATARRPRPMRWRAELGVRAARSRGDFADCDVVVLCVSADADVLANVTALAERAARRARSWSITPPSPSDTARERAARCCATRGIGFLDAPVSGGVEGARNGKLSIMVGGDAPTLDDRARPVLESYAARITHMGAHRRRPGDQGGEPGAGRRHRAGGVRRPGAGREARPGRRTCCCRRWRPARPATGSSTSAARRCCATTFNRRLQERAAAQGPAHRRSRSHRAAACARRSSSRR